MAPARPKTAQDALQQMQGGQYWDPLDLAMRDTTNTESPEQTLRFLKSRGYSDETASPAPGRASQPAAPSPTPAAAPSPATQPPPAASPAPPPAAPTPPPAAPAPTPAPPPAAESKSPAMDALTGGGAGGPAPAAAGGSAAPAMASLMAQAQPLEPNYDVSQSGPSGLRPGLGQRSYPQYNYALASLRRSVY